MAKTIIVDGGTDPGAPDPLDLARFRKAETSKLSNEMVSASQNCPHTKKSREKCWRSRDSNPGEKRECYL